MKSLYIVRANVLNVLIPMRFHMLRPNLYLGDQVDSPNQPANDLMKHAGVMRKSGS